MQLFEQTSLREFLEGLSSPRVPAPPRDSALCLKGGRGVGVGRSRVGGSGAFPEASPAIVPRCPSISSELFLGVRKLD